MALTAETCYTENFQLMTTTQTLTWCFSECQYKLKICVANYENIAPQYEPPGETFTT